MLDELRFGPARTLNLREGLPTVPAALRRADGWVRGHQLQGSREVLVITGRGSHSPDGEAAIKKAVDQLLRSLRRQGVVAGHQEHNPGAFVVTLAPVRSLVEAAPRRRDPAPRASTFTFPGLDDATTALLQSLAERTLDDLGVTPTPERLRDEMHRHLRRLAPALQANRDPNAALRRALQAALADYD